MNKQSISLYNLLGQNGDSFPFTDWKNINEEEFIPFIYIIDKITREKLLESNLPNNSPGVFIVDVHNDNQFNVVYSMLADFERIKEESNEIVIYDELIVNDALYLKDNFNLVNRTFEKDKQEFIDYFSDNNLTIKDVNKIYILFTLDVFLKDNDQLEYFVELKNE